MNIEQKTLNGLYAGTHEMVVNFAGKIPYHVELTTNDYNVKTNQFDLTPDCRVYSFADNVWFRTPKGVKAERYKSLTTLTKAITLAARSRGLEVESFDIKEIEVL